MAKNFLVKCFKSNPIHSFVEQKSEKLKDDRWPDGLIKKIITSSC